MSKTLRVLIIFLAFDAVVVCAYFGIKALGSGRRQSARRPLSPTFQAFPVRT